MYRQVSEAQWDKDNGDIIINTEGEVEMTEEDAELFFKSIPILTEKPTATVEGEEHDYRN